MSDDPCDRARQAMNELCGVGLGDGDSNTFYVRVMITQGRGVTPSDADEVAREMEAAAGELAARFGIDSRTLRTQTVPRDDNVMDTFFKIPISEMSPEQLEMVQRVVDQRARNFTSRDVAELRLVDKKFVKEDVPELIGAFPGARR